MPCSEKRARKLLEARRARVARLYPFTIRLVDLYVEDCALQPMRLSLDPGSKTTGLALSRIETQVYYPRPLTRLPHLGEHADAGRVPRADRLAGEVLSLPVNARLTEDDVTYVAGRIRAFYGDR